MNPISPINVFDLNICFNDERVFTQPGEGVENNLLDVDGLNSAGCSYRSGLTFSFPDSPTYEFSPTVEVPYVAHSNTHETNYRSQEQMQISHSPVEIYPSTSEPSSSSTFNETPVVDSGRKRNRPYHIWEMASTPIKKHNYTEISYLVALLYLFSNVLPAQQPPDIANRTWNYLLDMAKEGKLVQIHGRNPLIIKSIARLDFFYYTLGRFGTYQALLRSDVKDKTFEERDSWWFKSKIFGPIATIKKIRDDDQKIWVYRTLYLPESLRLHLEAFDDRSMLWAITQIFERTLSFSLQNEELATAIQWGVEMREINILRPVEESLKLAMQEVEDGYLYSQWQGGDASLGAPPLSANVQTDVSNSVNGTANQKRQRTNAGALAGSSSEIDQIESTVSVQAQSLSKYGIMLRKIYALSILLDGKIEGQKPKYISFEKWDALKREELVIPATICADANMVTLCFKIPRDYDEYCKLRTLYGKKGIVRFSKTLSEDSLFKWWARQGNQKQSTGLLKIGSKNVDAPEGSALKWVERSVAISSENVMCPRFAEMSLEGKLDALKHVFKITFSKSYSRKACKRIEKKGFVNVEDCQRSFEEVMTAFNNAVNEVFREQE